MQYRRAKGSGKKMLVKLLLLFYVRMYLFIISAVIIGSIVSIMIIVLRQGLRLRTARIMRAGNVRALAHLDDKELIGIPVECSSATISKSTSKFYIILYSCYSRYRLVCNYCSANQTIQAISVGLQDRRQKYL